MLMTYCLDKPDCASIGAEDSARRRVLESS
jgi:hypothetical protein